MKTVIITTILLRESQPSVPMILSVKQRVKEILEMADGDSSILSEAKTAVLLSTLDR